MIEPGTPADVRFAARLAVEGVVPEDKVRAALAKQRELAERGTPMSIAEMTVRLKWISATEAAWLADPDAPKSDLLPGMRLERPLGVGGMSRVYGGVDTGTRTPVAVKMLLPKLRRDPRARARFRAEAEALCRLEHPNLVKGFYFHEHDGVDYLVMERVDGGTALERLDRDGVFAENDALSVVLAAAKALDYLSSQGLIHRDVKPGNVLLGTDGVAKVCDLGLACERGAAASENGNTCGTAQYFSPEQASGDDALDARADIYALGVTLIQLVIGKLPFDGVADEEATLRRMTEELRAKELKGLSISQHLHYFIHKMTARERDVRYPSHADLIADVEECLAERARIESSSRRVTPTPGSKFKAAGAVASAPTSFGGRGPRRAP